ncbi:putative uncharacterized protein [Mycolicibacterium brisbanense]|uniref:Uncharacterized protein n=1 Tax=Mycolicibacterium brisbanense TaxID=146020 RepID=A0A117I4K0_9MYCO|nr:putative uncharacterized protein [Mycolicibacterium brisbanense]
MYEIQRVLELHQQGHCSASIAVRLGVPTEYVREVVERYEAKLAIQHAKWLVTPEGQAAVKAQRMAAAKAKRAEALRMLAELESGGV